MKEALKSTRAKRKSVCTGKIQIIHNVINVYLCCSTLFSRALDGRGLLQINGRDELEPAYMQLRP